MFQVRSLNRVGAAASLVMLQAAAHAAPMYQITSLGSGVIPNRISESGTVVGSLYYQRPLAWRDGVTHYLDVGADTSANWASDITASGLIVGSANSTAAVWQGGQWISLPGSTSKSHAWAANDSGLIGGEVDDQAVIWRNGQRPTMKGQPFGRALRPSTSTISCSAPTAGSSVRRSASTTRDKSSAVVGKTAYIPPIC